jgi:hypothetical protein
MHGFKLRSSDGAPASMPSIDLVVYSDQGIQVSSQLHLLIWSGHLLISPRIGPFLGDYSCLVVGSLTTLPLLLRDEAILRCSGRDEEDGLL